MRPRVLVLTTTYPGRLGDATPRFVHDLSRALNDDFELLVLTPRVPGAPSQDELEGVSVTRFPYAPRRLEGLADGALVANLRSQPWRVLEVPLLFGALWWYGRRAVREFDPAIIHAHWTVPNGLVATAISQPDRRPVLATSHGVDLHALRVGPIEWLRRIAMRRIDRVTAVSKELADRAESLGAPSPTPVIPMGVDTAELAALEPLPRANDTVLFVGRLAEKKGVSVLLAATAKSPRLRVRIAGDGPLHDDLVQQATSLAILDRVTFLGRLDRAHVLQEMRSCAVLAIPSITASDGDREGTPVVLAEAVATRTPVVASDVGGLGELLDDETGWVVPERDPEALAVALTEVMTGSAAADRADAAFDRILRGLDLATTRDAYAALLCELLESD